MRYLAVRAVLVSHVGRPVVVLFSQSMLLCHCPSPSALHRTRLLRLPIICFDFQRTISLKALSPLYLTEHRARTQARTRSSTFLLAPPAAAVQRTTRFWSGSSHTQRACTVVLVSAVSAGGRWQPSSMVLPWQVLVCACEAVRGTEEKQVRAAQRQFSRC